MRATVARDSGLNAKVRECISTAIVSGPRLILRRKGGVACREVDHGRPELQIGKGHFLAATLLALYSTNSNRKHSRVCDPGENYRTFNLLRSNFGFIGVLSWKANYICDTRGNEIVIHRFGGQSHEKRVVPANSPAQIMQQGQLAWLARTRNVGNVVNVCVHLGNIITCICIMRRDVPHVCSV